MATELPEEPKSRKEQYLADIAGQDVELPAEPKSREEQYLAYIAENGGGGGGGGTSNFNQLSNRPKYNGTTMTGDTNIPEVKTYTAGANITISGNEISATDTTYSAGTGLDLTGTSFSVDYTDTQAKLTAGSNITIDANNEISATDTTYSAFTGTDGTAAGSAGLVPAPATTDAGKFLKADGTWDTAGGSGPTVVQTTGTSTADVMSQNAVSSMVYDNPGTNRYHIKIGDASTYDYTGTTSKTVIIGAGATAAQNTGGSANYATIIGGSATTKGWYGVSIGYNARCDGDGGAVAIGGADSADQTRASGTGAVAIGQTARASALGSVAVGRYSSASSVGEFNIGSTNTSFGYNSSNYRLLTGLYDPQSAHDAATKGYVDGTTETYTIATADWSALSSSSPYTYQATVTATYTIGANTIAELLNDSPVAFATYGFAIGSISSQSVTIYSIGQPSASVSLKINYKG